MLPESAFVFSLDLVAPAIITRIEMSVKEADQVQIDLYNSKNTIYKTERLINEKEKTGSPILIKVGEEASICDRVRITFINVPHKRATTICYVLLKGFKEETKKSTPAKKKKNTSKNKDEDQ